MEFLDSVRKDLECLDHPCFLAFAVDHARALSAHSAVAPCVCGQTLGKQVPQIFVRMPDIGDEFVTWLLALY